jgi:regulator of PEP synthase PpsR (kinase-PPPase family)
LSTAEGLTIHIVSDSLGETADTVARAAAAQFEYGTFVFERLPRISSGKQLVDLVRAHCGPNCIFFHTFANESLRQTMREICAELEAHEIDILGPAIGALTKASGVAPSEEVGAVRKTDRGYFERVEALEFAVKHDDGRNPEGLDEAEIVLIGVSRTSKTPLSMYLGFKGYKVANIPLAPGVDPPKELFQIDVRKVFGLVSDPELLVAIRRQRIVELGPYARRYADDAAVREEVDESRDFMRHLGCIAIHTGDRAVEEAAQEIIRYLER